MHGCNKNKLYFANWTATANNSFFVKVLFMIQHSYLNCIIYLAIEKLQLIAMNYWAVWL